MKLDELNYQLKQPKKPRIIDSANTNIKISKYIRMHGDGITTYYEAKLFRYFEVKLKQIPYPIRCKVICIWNSDKKFRPDGDVDLQLAGMSILVTNANDPPIARSDIENISIVI